MKKRRLKMKSNTKYDVIIIGAGPAGIAASIYLKRANVNCLLLESEAPGGLLNKIHKIENYPGFTDDTGSILAFRMYSQVESLGIDLKIEKVINIKNTNGSYEVFTKNNVFVSKYIIIATGKTPKKLEIKNSEKYEGKGISYCAVCDGALYRNKDIAIVGGGNTAIDTANYMSNIANKIYIINRSSNLRADQKGQEEIKKLENVNVLYNTKLKDIIGDDTGVQGVVLEDGTEINLSGIFVCIGQTNNSAFYQNLNLKTDNRGIVVDKDLKTTANNVYACGDSISKDLYQVVTATSEGAMVASNIIKLVRSK